MSATERVSTTIGGLQRAPGELIPWRWYAQQVLERLDQDDLAVYWYTGHGMRGVAPVPSDPGRIEVFYSDPDIRHAFRTDDPSSVPVTGYRESHAAGVHEVAEALAKGETLHLVARADISTTGRA